jgi:hypothetical protein
MRFERARGEALAAALVAAAAWGASVTGVDTLMFPELGALAHDVFTRPQGAWARAPLQLAVMPALAALVGLALARWLPLGLPAVTLSLGSTLLLLGLLRSPLAPAISAGLLPVALRVRSPWYPASILLVTVVLAGAVLLRAALRRAPPAPADAASRIDDQTEKAASGWRWLPGYALFALLAAVLTQARHLLLVPPLFVVAYEMFAHPEVCPWRARPWALLAACVAGAACGAGTVAWLGVGPLSAAVSLLAGVSIVRVLDLHVPPALAIGLLPQILPHAGLGFVASVALLCAWLVGSFTLAGFASRRFSMMRRPA